MEDYSRLCKSELIDKVHELLNLVETLMREKNRDELNSFPWAGNLGNWHWDVKNNSIICNEQKYAVLGYTPEEIPNPLTYCFFAEKLHPDDYDRVMENMSQHLQGLTPAYEVEYRIRAKNGEYKWFYDRGKIVSYSQDGKPLLVSGIVFDITEQKRLDTILTEQNIKLLELVNTDPLTKIFNRRALIDKLEYEIGHSLRSKTSLSILMLDIDYFKDVNDNHGHLTGDKVLIEVAEIIKKCVRISDIVGRYGGEEFLIILPESGLEEASLVAERIREKIQANIFSDHVRITISGGLKMHQGESLDQLLNNADKLMYQAKKNGRNQIVHNRMI